MNKTKNIFPMNTLFNILVLVSISVRFFNTDASSSFRFSTAYLDPGTGTMIISAIVGILATLILGIKTFWYKIVSIFKPPKDKKPE
ncbi:MAG: hypothetical protein GXY77_17930 [Fibrobacter sp.]|nr:hypothetical protein [Fibrobacter sp.]